MVRAWFLDEDVLDPKYNLPPRFVSLEELYRNSGVNYFQVDPETYKTDKILKEFLGGIENVEDYFNEKLDDYDIESHCIEHLHLQDEIRLVLNGCGYVDVRDKFDLWIRIELLPGDLITIPGGIYHRFAVEDKNLYRGLRLIKGDHKPMLRPADDNKVRKEYIHKLYNGEFDRLTEPTSQ